MVIHSPAPWTELQDGNAILDANGYQVALVTRQEGFDNKPLLLTAPKMLELLQLLDKADIFSGPDEAAIKSVIAEATGVQT